MLDKFFTALEENKMQMSQIVISVCMLLVVPFHFALICAILSMWDLWDSPLHPGFFIVVNGVSLVIIISNIYNEIRKLLRSKKC